ncbi:MAG: aldehyde:ferredoxin oxidoreductase [Planctomycetaceae bacterium]|nr:aldehyde:ferredoxin oxidoreductase [Planctomycetaceae bacterium]
MSVLGYHGQYLRIDLSSRKSEVVALAPGSMRHHIGGSGLGTHILLNETPGQVDPLGEEAPLIFVFSPLVGSPLTTSAKFAVMAKSPLTLRINDSLSSSAFAIAGKNTGYDAIVIVGIAEEPTCLVIDDGDVQFYEANDAWGTSSTQAAEILESKLGSGFQFASIGPAGEKLVRYATVSHDTRHAGRGGLGAVMGSKRLKAVAVRGNRRVQFAQPDKLLAYSKQLSQESLGPATVKYRELGTVSNLLTFNRLGTLPTRNFQQGSFEAAEVLAPESLATTVERTRASCAACTIGCEHIFRMPNQSQGVRLEYENLFALGPLCGISDPNAILAASARCDELGIDTISAGATIAFAMECAERGLLDADIEFGDADGLLALIDQIGQSDGLGQLLAQGTRAMSKTIGGGSEDFAPHVKGLEIPGYEPRALQTMALGFAVGARGADHNRSGAYQVDFSESVDRMNLEDDSVPLAIDTENESTIMDSLILCKFLRGVFSDRMASMAEMLNLVTGWDVDSNELAVTADRIVTAKKRYNIEQGWTPAEDALPKRFYQEELPEGASSGAILDEQQLQRLVRLYNTSRGWSEDGWLL